MGITSKGVQQMINMINRYHRIMANSPVHIIRENATIFFDRLQIDWSALDGFVKTFLKIDP